MNARLILTTSFAALALALAGCDANASKERRAPAAPAPLVKVVVPRDLTTSRTEEVTGTLNPAQSLQLGFEVGGRLAKIHVKKGQRVKAGDLLASLDTEIVNAQVTQAQANLAAATAGFGLASDVAQRNEQLLAAGSVSDVQQKSSASTSEQARAQLLAAKAALAQARAARRKHDLRAPFDGTVVSAPEQVGATVGPGVPLFGLEQLDALLLQATVPESARGDIREGDRVKVAAASTRAATDEAQVRTVVPSADPATRRIPVDVVVPNADGRFVAHTLARALFTLGEPIAAQAVPSTALSSSGGDHVYVVADGGVAKKVPVEVLVRGADEVVVRAASPLQKVIDQPGPGVADGLNVAVR